LIRLKAILRNTTVAALSLGAATACAQQPLDLDPTFSTTISEVYVSSAALMPDGKLLVSGEMKFGSGTTYYLMRLNADGSRDINFPYVGAGGSKITPWADRYYVSTGGLPSRLLPTGLLDNSFQHLNDNAPAFSSFQGGDYHVYPDGSVVITGSHMVQVPDSGWIGTHHMIWFNNDGTLDLTRQPRKGNGPIHLIVPQPDGKFLLSGASTQWEGVPVSNTFRVHPDGTLDDTFNAAVTWGEAQGITVLPDGRLIVSGLMKTEFSSPDSLHLVRLMPSGELDPTFNNLLVLRNEQFDQFLFLKHNYIPGYGIALHGNYDEVEGHQRNGFIMVDENGYLPAQPLGGMGCGEFFDDISGIYRKGSTGMLTAPDGMLYIWGAYHGYDDGTTNDPTQRFVSRLYGLDVGVREHALAPLQLQPNPSYGPLTVTLAANTTALHAEVLDAHGRVVWSMALGASTEQVQLDLAELSEGAYLLRLRMQDGGVRNGRFVIMR